MVISIYRLISYNFHKVVHGEHLDLLGNNTPPYTIKHLRMKAFVIVFFPSDQVRAKLKFSNVYNKKTRYLVGAFSYPLFRQDIS